MPLIRIVQSSELAQRQAELGTNSLLARDHVGERKMRLVEKRLDTGKGIDKTALHQLVEDEPAATSLEVGQEWETNNVRRTPGKDQPSVRRVRITAIGDTHAEVENLDTGNRTAVRLAAFSGRGMKNYRPSYGS